MSSSSTKNPARFQLGASTAFLSNRFEFETSGAPRVTSRDTRRGLAQGGRSRMREAAIVRQILLELGNELDFRLWRNNSGALTDVTGRVVKYGLGVGSADLIGILAPRGTMVCFEVKTPDARSQPSKDQIAWGNVITNMGGLYVVVRSAGEARQWLEWARVNRT
jgi:hypothetical protein